MARGVLSGIGLGAAFSIGVAGVLSVLVPMSPQPAPQLGTAELVAPAQPTVPQAAVTVTDAQDSSIVQPQVSLRTPLSEDLPKEPEAAALAPQIVTDIDSSIPPEPAAAPEPVTAPQIETAALAPLPTPLAPIENGAVDPVPAMPAALPQPQTGTAADLTTPRPLPEGVAVRIEEDAPVLPNPQALAPMIPDDSVDTDVAEQSAEPVQPPAEGEETLVVVPPAPRVETPPVTSAQTPDEPEETVTAQAPKPRVLTSPGTQATTLGTAAALGTSARPRVGTPAKTLLNSTTEADAAPTVIAAQAPVDPDNAPPLRRYAQPFENPEGKPLMSIVLIDSGADLDAAEIGFPALSSFPYPVSFAVDVRLVDAAKRMERYRAEGFDVLAMLDLPEGARPTDAEVSMSVALNGLPEIVGVLEGTGEGLQGTREVADQVTGILKASGHGLVTQSKGLNSMPKLALKEGVPAAPVFRDFDGEGQQPRVIRRFLDQAAFKAGQEGGVIMLGRLRPETIEALLVWGLADRAGSVALAPVSATLMAQR